MRVLLVDDDPRFLDALTALLESFGGLDVVGRAPDGATGVEETARLRPDVVLMDLDMPGLGGVEATRLIRERTPASKVVILSGSEVVAHSAPSIAAGAIAYVRKSNTIDELQALLETLR